jgi:hypothetical protein
LYGKAFDVSIIFLPNKAKKYLEAIGLKSKMIVLMLRIVTIGAEQCLELWEPMGTFFFIYDY